MNFVRNGGQRITAAISKRSRIDAAATSPYSVTAAAVSTTSTTDLIIQQKANIRKKSQQKVKEMTENPLTFKDHLETLPLMKYPKHYRVECIDSVEKADKEICLLRSKIDQPFGLDLEWRPNFRKGGKEHKTALIQICNSDTILLLQVSQMKRLPSELCKFLQDRQIYKAGVNIRADGMKLYRDFGVPTNGLIELMTMSNTCGSPKLEYTPLRSLRVLTGLFIEQNMPKGRVRLSNWAQPVLTPMQKKYAATDAYGSYKLCHIFSQLRAEMGQTEIPPPIHLSDEIQTPVQKKPSIKQTKSNSKAEK
ncbi:hypothetical protein DFQ28_001143, partial [Apophysomyces sp. BC1034]